MALPAETSVRGSNGRTPATGSDDWAVQAADTVERVVDSIRGKTTGPITTVARALVFGLLAAILGITALVLLIVGMVRAIDVYLPEDVWAAYALTGGIFFLVGLFLWTRRRRKGDD
jgi:hypothetical protein